MENPFEERECQDAAFEVRAESPLGLSGPFPGRSAAEQQALIDEKVRENRLRRMARRQGLQLEKSRLRDIYATGFGTYQLVRIADGVVAASRGQSGYGLSLDDIEKHLTSRD